jgi:UTP--glucose-1-phosphate uridylyltransferase
MITKAVIPAAGLGTRFLPATKVQPKEMLPIVDTPVIHFVVEEAIRSGIDDIILVTGRGKRTIEDYFDASPELEQHLARNHKDAQLEEIRRISSLVDIHYIRQKSPAGLGDAVLKAEKHVGDEPFAVLLGDDIITSSVPCIKQLMPRYERLKGPILAVTEVARDKLSSYGIIKGRQVEERLYLLDDIIEKPTRAEAPSTMGTIGRYILTPDIFGCLKTVVPGKDGELQLTDAIRMLVSRRDVYAYEIEGTRYDAGNKTEYVKAVIDFALEREDLRDEIKKHMLALISHDLTKGVS